ncbi:MAG: hypothetical protein LBO02_02840 [Holosporaceae bacterium]|nr:hypothetical protein [Holosporaceae bacterium]
MADEINAIIEEINEEIKNDQLLAFFKKHKNAILGASAVIAASILAYSSWYSRRNQQMAEITNALVDVLQSPASKNHAMMDGLIEDAPAQLYPLLTVVKLGRKLHDFSDMEESSKALLALTQRRGVDIVWKDLAVIIYASYRLKPVEELIKLLEPLAGDERPFRFTAMELLAMNYENSGNHEKALEYLEKIINSKESPKTLKKRVSMLLDHLKNNREKK